MILETFPQNYTSRVEITDFEKHFLSGFPQIQDHMKKLNFFKKRFDGFIYSGRETYTKVVNSFLDSGKPL
jgi:hypothetical protein